MAFNGSGVFQRVYDWITDRDNNVRIRADRMDEELYGIAAGLTNTICRDGQSTIAADIPFNGKKITNLGAATSDNDALNRTTGDGRYQRTPLSLTTETAFADGDIFGFYDLSATADRGGTYSSLKTALTTDFRADGRMMPVGTRQAFQQTTPPTGWTKESSSAYNDAVASFTTGTVATGGSASFASTFSSRTPTGTVDGASLSSSQLPSHAHVDTKKQSTSGIGGGGGTGFLVDSSSNNSQTNQTNPTTGTSIGSGSTHVHPLTMAAMDFATKFVQMCIGIKA